jgi:hypothetical protein
MADGTFHGVADIQAKFKKLSVGTGTMLTTTEIEAEILRTEAYVEGKVDPFYTFSAIAAATTTKAFQIIKEACVLRTAGHVNEILRKNGVANPDPEEKNRLESMIGQSEKILKGIALHVTQGNVEGAIMLPGVTARALTTTGTVTGQGTSVPLFDKDIDQW